MVEGQADRYFLFFVVAFQGVKIDIFQLIIPVNIIIIFGRSEG